MGEVYRATDKQTGMVVAIKRMLVDVPEGADEGALYHAQRFEEECKLLQSLAFPGIPAFVESFQEEQRSIIVMEFIEGVDLEKQVADQMTLAGTYLPTRQAVEYTIQVARILEFMHAHRPRPVIHRDIKPANIIVRHSDDRIYLVDFGLAREVGGATSTKTAVGTAGYAPLEQYKGHPTTRTDQFSLGATLHFMLCGQHPLPLQMEPLDKVRPDLPHDLCWLVRKATMSEQEDRFDSVYEMRRELERILPLVTEAEREQQQQEHNQTRMGILPPTQTLKEERKPAQRVKVGASAEASDPLEGFGLSHPLEHNLSAQQEFQRQAVLAERERRSVEVELHETPSPRRSLWRFFPGLLLLAGIAILFRLHRASGLALASSLLPGQVITAQAGLVTLNGRTYVGRQAMSWPDYLLSFPWPKHDGVAFDLASPPGRTIGLSTTADGGGFEDKATLLLAFLDAACHPLAAFQVSRDRRTGELMAQPCALDPDQEVTLSTSATRVGKVLTNPSADRDNVLVIPLPATRTRPTRAVLSSQNPAAQPWTIQLSL